MSGTERAEEAVDAVLDNLLGRRGFDYWWDDIDSEIQSEIRESLVDDIHSVYSATDQSESVGDSEESE